MKRPDSILQKYYMSKLPKYQQRPGTVLKQQYSLIPSSESGLEGFPTQAEVARQAELQKGAAQVERARKIRQQQGTISKPAPVQSVVSKTLEVLSNPVEAFGYAARNERIPNYFSRSGQTNGLNTIVNTINPFAVASSLGQAAKDVYGVGEAALTGNFDEAGNKLFTAGLTAAGSVPFLSAAKPALGRAAQFISDKASRVFPSRVRYGVDPEYGFYTRQGDKIKYDLGDVFKPKWITPSGNKFNPDYLKTLNRRDLTEYLSRFPEKDRAAIEKIISSSSNIPKPSLLRNTSPEQLREIQALASEGRIYGYQQGMTPKPVSDWFRNSSWDEFAKEMRGTLSNFGIDPTNKAAVEEFRKTMIKGLNQAYWNDMKPVSGTGEWLNTFNRMNKNGGVLKFAKGGPIVNPNGYKDGEPPAGSNWRIPGNKITMNLPGMPNRIFAVPNVGLAKFVYNGEDVEFPGADYVDEYEMQDGGLPKFQQRPGTYRPLNELSDIEKRQLAQRIVNNARAKLLNNEYVDVPEYLKNTPEGKKYGAYSCIGGVCNILAEEKAIPNVIWKNTEFAKIAPQLGFPNRGWGLKGLENLEPGDVIQYLDREQNSTNAVPHHAQIFLGINSKTGEYEFFDNYTGRQQIDSYWNSGNSNLGLRSYSKKELLEKLDPKKKRNEDFQAVIYKINPYNPKTDPYTASNIKKEQKESLEYEMNNLIPYEYRLRSDSPLRPVNASGNVRDVSEVPVDIPEGAKEFFKYVNNFEKRRELLKKLYNLGYKSRATNEDINDSFLNVFGILEQENKLSDRWFGGTGGVENTYEKIAKPKSASIGPGQIKFNSLTKKWRKEFGINSPKDLYDWEKILPLMTALDINAKQQMSNWGKDLYKRIIGSQPYSLIEQEGVSSKEFKWDEGRISPYFYRGPGPRDIKENLREKFLKRINQSAIGRNLSQEQKSEMINAYVDRNIRKEQKVFDPGSYGRNVWESWSRNIERTLPVEYKQNIPARQIYNQATGQWEMIPEQERKMITLPEVIMTSRPSQRKIGGLTKYQQRPGTISLRPTAADSTAIYLNALEKEKFYRNNPKYKKVTTENKDYDVSFKNKKFLQQLANESIDLFKQYTNTPHTDTDFGFSDIEIINIPAKTTRNRLGRLPGSNVVFKAPDILNTIDTYYNPNSPVILFSPEIMPQGERIYISDYYGDTARAPYYEPLAVKPYAMRTEKEKIEWERKYGKKPNPKSSKTKFTKTLEKITTEDKNTSISQISPAIIKEPIRTINAPSGTSGVFGPNQVRIGEYDPKTNTFYADYEGMYGKTSDANKTAQDFIRNREQLEQYIFERTGAKPIIKPLSETKTLKKGGLTKYQERPGTVIRDNIPSLGDAFRRAEMDRFRKQYDVDIPAESSFAFMEDWMNSPMYKMMLTSSALKTPGPRRRIDYTNMINRGWGYKFPEQESEFDEINHFRRLALKRFKENPNSFLNVQLEPLVKGAYTPSRNVIELSKDLKFPERLLTGVHEVSHATDINEYDDRYIPISDVNKMKRYAEDYQKQKGFWQKLNENSEYNKYVADPTETRARLNTLRFFGKQRGVYNPFKEKLIDKNKLKSFEDQEAYQQLRLIYSDDQILDMLNSISMTPNQDLPQAKSGGQHGGLDRWFAEKWVDIKTGKPCGRQEGEDRGYPACRPSKRVSSKTPKTSSELSSEERARFKSAKTSSQRIPYSHKRRK